MPARLLIVDDNAILVQWLVDLCQSTPAVEVLATTESAKEALRVLTRTDPDVVVLDAELSGAAAVLEAAKRTVPGTRVLLLTGEEPPAIDASDVFPLSKDEMEPRTFLRAIRQSALPSTTAEQVNHGRRRGRKQERQPEQHLATNATAPSNVGPPPQRHVIDRPRLVV